MSALFSAALGLAGSVYGANKAAKSQAASMAQQQYEFERSRELQNANMAIGLDDRRLQQEENQYQRAMERINRRKTGDERRYQMSEYEGYQDQLLSERRDVIERQLMSDKEAARKSQFELEQYLQNRDLAQGERDEAMAALREAKAIASGERDEDKRRLLEDRAKSDIEREFVVQQYQEAQNTFAAEREEQNQFRDMLMGRIDSVQANSQDFANSLGMPMQVDPMTQGDVDAEYQVRADEYMSDVDRAAQGMASSAETTLVRRGMSDSTLAEDTRAQLTRQVSDQYTKARRAAYDDATKYISGRQAMTSNDRNAQMDRRKYLVGENTGLEGMAMNGMLQLPGVASTTGQYNLLNAVPTGIYDRSISSANDYQAPIAIGTGIYDQMNIGSQLSGYLNTPSAASTGYGQIQSGIYNPMSMNFGNPSNAFNNASNIANQMLSGSQANYANASDNAYKAGQGMAAGVANFSDELGSWWDARNEETPAGGGKEP